MRITRAVFFRLFGVHPPARSPSMYVTGGRYVFIEDEVAELERLFEEL